MALSINWSTLVRPCVSICDIRDCVGVFCRILDQLIVMKKFVGRGRRDEVGGGTGDGY